MTTTTLDTSRYLHHSKPVWNTIAILYTLLGYGGGVWLLLLPHIWLNVVGVLLLSHALIISAYLTHEFMHGTIFASRVNNARFGNLMLWLNGGCYARFDDLTHLHIAHHVDRVDYCRFDLAAYLKQLPAPVRRGILALEWCYFPALAFVLRIYAIFSPFWSEERRSQRWRNMGILAVRVLLFIGLGVLSLKALLLYFLSYIIMLNILRFVDAFQHTYEAFPVGVPFPKHDRQYEQTNTFSNLISNRYRWLNLLLLNFGYHNAHHELMKCPWHSLPELDQALFSGKEAHYITLGQLVKNYHRYRLARIDLGQGQALDAQGNHTLDTFYGAIEVSFLVLPA